MGDGRTSFSFASLSPLREAFSTSGLDGRVSLVQRSCIETLHLLGWWGRGGRERVEPNFILIRCVSFCYYMLISAVQESSDSVLRPTSHPRSFSVPVSSVHPN